MPECSATIESTTMLCHISYFAVSFDIPETSNWIKGNAGMYGYYRVNYDEDNWKKLVSQLHTNHKVRRLSL